MDWKLNPWTKLLWAIQTLVTINPGTGEQKTYFPTPVNGGGYDDVLFRNGKAYLSASAPANDPNTDPAIVSVKLSGSSAVVTPVFAGNASTKDVLTGATVTLNLQDPDSMISTPGGDILLDSQDNAELILVRHLDTPSQSAIRIPLTSPYGTAKADDTIFVTASDGFILVSDLDANTVYKIERQSFAPGTAFTAVAAPGAAFVGRLDLDFGLLTPIVTGLKNPRGMAFVQVPDEDDRDGSRDQLADACEALFEQSST